MMSKRPSSGVWAYFKPAGDDDRLAECTCDTCPAKKRIVSRGPPGSQKKTWSVKSLWVHLRTHHPEEHKAANAVKEDNAAKKRKWTRNQQGKRKYIVFCKGLHHHRLANN